MSDYHEMFEAWGDVVKPYDPDYPIGNGDDNENESSNKPSDPDDWVNKSDFEGGF